MQCTARCSVLIIAIVYGRAMLLAQASEPLSGTLTKEITSGSTGITLSLKNATGHLVKDFRLCIDPIEPQTPCSALMRNVRLGGLGDWDVDDDLNGSLGPEEIDNVVNPDSRKARVQVNSKGTGDAGENGAGKCIGAEEQSSRFDITIQFAEKTRGECQVTIVPTTTDDMGVPFDIVTKPGGLIDGINRFVSRNELFPNHGLLLCAINNTESKFAAIVIETDVVTTVSKMFLVEPATGLFKDLEGSFSCDMNLCRVQLLSAIGPLEILSVAVILSREVPLEESVVFLTPEFSQFVRGDSNGNSDSMELSDPVFILNFLFLGDPGPPCLDAIDSNDDGVVNISDAIYMLVFLFFGGAAPPPPTEECDYDLTQDYLGCTSFGPCG